MKTRSELTYEIIENALAGDDGARELILEHYEPYIIKLSKIPFYDDQGHMKYKIDEDFYMCLKLKLHEVLLSFKIT